MGAVASHVYGQADLYSKTPEQISATSLNYSIGLAIADGMVVVCSANDNRVMVFPPGPPASDGIAAIRVLGQPDFTSQASGSALDRMSLPWDVAYDSVANTLWVVDTFNSRVLSFENFVVRVQGLTSLGVVITFQGQQPSVFVYPKGFVEGRPLLENPLTHKIDPVTANIYPGQRQLLIQPQVIEELENSNETVSSTSTLSLLNYTVSTTVDASNNQQFTFSAPELPGGAQVFFVYCGSPTLTLPSQAVDPIFPFCCGPDFEQQRSIFRHQALGSEVRDGAIGMALRTAFQHLAPAPRAQRDPKCDLTLAEQQHQQQHHHLHAPFIERDDDHNNSHDRIWYGGWSRHTNLLFSRSESNGSRSVGSGVGDSSLQLLLSI